MAIIALIVLATGGAIAVTQSGGDESDRTVAPLADDRSDATDSPDTTVAPVGPVVVPRTSTTDSVDLAQAASVTEQLWAGRSDGLTRRDITTLQQYDGGALLEYDVGLICRTGCPPPNYGPPTSIQVNVSHQAGWPARFLAVVTYEGCSGASTCTRHREVLVQAL